MRRAGGQVRRTARAAPADAARGSLAAARAATRDARSPRVARSKIRVEREGPGGMQFLIKYPADSVGSSEEDGAVLARERAKLPLSTESVLLAVCTDSGLAAVCCEGIVAVHDCNDDEFHPAYTMVRSAPAPPIAPPS